MRWIFFLVLFAACTSSLPEEQGSVEVLFCPQDDCYGVFYALVSQASVVECALYRVSGPLVTLLEEKHAAVVVDGEAKIVPAGASRRRDAGLMHNKFCILRSILPIFCESIL